MLLRVSLGTVYAVCLIASAFAQTAPGANAPSGRAGSAPAEWPATGGKPGQKREYRDAAGAKIIEYYDHRGIKRTIRDRGLND